MTGRVLLAVWAACALGACTFEDRHVACQEPSDCASNEMCYEGFCVRKDGVATRDGGASDGDENGSGGRSVGSVSNPSSAAGTSGAAGSGSIPGDGPSGEGSSSDGTGSSGSGGTGTGGSGSGGAGTGAAANGGMTPGAAGSGGASPPSAADGGASPPGSCSDGEEQPCLVVAATATTSEACNRGMQRCSGGSWSTCVGQPMPAQEQCNGLDDDCDTMVDEEIALECFPDGASGCTQASDGSFACEGVCARGTRTCTQGQLSDCTGARTPGEEVCTPAGMQGSDENCDGAIDETCACMPGEMRGCYNGGAGTLDVGTCKAGTQTCSASGALGACTGAVLPAAETCANQGADDNCDGAADNIANLGKACAVANGSGVCREGKLQCEAGKAELTCVPNSAPAIETCNGRDDDCNGAVDDTFNLQTDANNCGACGKTCGANQACCAGGCVGTRNNVNNCGGCGMKCPAGNMCRDGECIARDPMEPDPMEPDPMEPEPMQPNTCQPACGGGEACCGGACVDTKSDAKNCGACGNTCTGGTRPGCCAGRCVDLVSNSHCGQCGRDCSLLLNGGLTCSCTMSDGNVQCTGPVLNVCL